MFTLCIYQHKPGERRRMLGRLHFNTYEEATCFHRYIALSPELNDAPVYVGTEIGVTAPGIGYIPHYRLKHVQEYLRDISEHFQRIPE